VASERRGNPATDLLVVGLGEPRAEVREDEKTTRRPRWSSCSPTRRGEAAQGQGGARLAGEGHHPRVGRVAARDPLTYLTDSGEAVRLLARRATAWSRRRS